MADGSIRAPAGEISRQTVAHIPIRTRRATMAGGRRPPMPVVRDRVSILRALPVAALFVCAAVGPAAADTTVRLRHWNNIAIDASGLDHTPVSAGEVRDFGEQLGPTRASRAMAIVHIAMFDAVNAT